MPENVWEEELCTGLIDELKKSLGNLCPSDSAFFVRKPEEDFKFEVFPCVSVYLKEYKFDPQRYCDVPDMVDKTADKKFAILEDQAIPFNFNVQIDFWTRYQKDRDTLVKTWLNTGHFKQFILPVYDDGGEKRYANAFINGSIKKVDLLDGNKRIFHSIVEYTIWVELDSGLRYNKAMVNTINIDSNPEEREEVSKHNV